MRHVFLLTFLVTLFPACIDNEEVSQELEKYSITSALLTQNLRDADAQHYFNLSSVTVNGEDTSIIESTFDPSNEVGERWTMDSINGRSPTSAELKDFDHTHNTKKKGLNGQVDKNSWEIIKNDEDSLIIRFEYDRKSLPHKYAFLGECQALAYFNKQTGHLEKVEYGNEKPIKIKLFNVSNLDMRVYFDYHEEEGHYLIRTEELLMEVHLLGQVIPIREQNTYRNYRLVE